MTELRLTWDELRTVVHQTPRRRFKTPDGQWETVDGAYEAVAVHVARRLGVRLVVEGDDSEVTYEPPQQEAS